MSDTLLLYVDGYPHFLVEERGEFLDDFGQTVPVTPGLGYSANIYYELFAGVRPDDVNFFNKFTLRSQDESPVAEVPRSVAALLDTVSIHPYVSRGLHILYDKIFDCGQLATIPFQYLKYFTRQEYHDIFYTSEIETIFNRHELDVVQDLDGSYPGDRAVYQEALRQARESNQQFVGFGGLDPIGHQYGLNSDRHRDRTKQLDKWCQEIVSAFREISPDANVVIFSDHGFTNVEQAVGIDLEERFGKPSPRSYIYFLDSTFLRVWSQDNNLLESIKSFLESRQYGTVLTQSDREDFGLASESVGDLIFLMDEGNVFYPSFMGGRLDKSMHGYAPSLDSQQAFLTYSGDRELDLPSTTVGVFDFVDDLLEGE